MKRKAYFISSFDVEDTAKDWMFMFKTKKALANYQKYHDKVYEHADKICQDYLRQHATEIIDDEV